jgi:hypothetical protein
MRRSWRVGVALALTLIGAMGATSAVQAAPDFLVSGGPHKATRAADGSTSLSVTVSNLTSAEMTASLETLDGSCAPATAEPTIPAANSTSVTFTMPCTEGSAPRAAVLGATSESLGAPPAEVTLSFTVEPATASAWWNRLCRHRHNAF